MQPRFAGKNTQHDRQPTPYAYSNFTVEEPAAPETQPNPWLRAAKYTAVTLGVGAAILSPLWVPILGVGLACNNNAPEGAIAKIKPVAGGGPAVADALCPSVFVMKDQTTQQNNAPSWKDFSQNGDIYDNGLVTDQKGIKGAYANGSFFDAELIRGYQSAQIGSTDPENFAIGLLKGAAPTKTVNDNGDVYDFRAKNGFKQRLGKVELLGEYKGKSLKDVPEHLRNTIKAAAGAYSQSWSG
jgi:hypothetical protein